MRLTVGRPAGQLGTMWLASRRYCVENIRNWTLAFLEGWIRDHAVDFHVDSGSLVITLAENIYRHLQCSDWIGLCVEAEIFDEKTMWYKKKQKYQGVWIVSVWGFLCGPTYQIVNSYLWLTWGTAPSYIWRSQPRWLSGLTRSCVHSQWMLVDHCVLSNWDRILVRAVKGLISRAGMVSICPLLWQRDVKLQQTYGGNYLLRHPGIIVGTHHHDYLTGSPVGQGRV